MTYGWREADSQLVELCDECGFDSRGITDDVVPALLAGYAGFAVLVNHPDAAHRPAPETWSAEEYAAHVIEVTGALLGYIADVTRHPTPAPFDNLDTASSAAHQLVGSLDDADLAAPVRGVYSREVTVGWVVNHLLHDLEHHVHDLRRGYARLALDQLPGDWDAGTGRG